MARRATGALRPTRRTLSRAAALAAVIMAGLIGCDPPSNPVSTTMNPRDPGGAELQTLRIDSLSTESYVHSSDITESDRVQFGRWGQITAMAFLQVDPDLLIELTGDSLSDATISGAELSFNCAGIQGDTIDLTLMTIPIDAAWMEDEIAWETRPVFGADSIPSAMASCAGDTLFPERTIALSNSMIERWIANPDSNFGFSLAIVGDSTVVQLASTENNLAYESTVGNIENVPGPRIRFTATPTVGEDVTVVVSADQFLQDTHIFSPDGAMDEGTERLQVGRGVTHRLVVRPELPDFDEHSNVHQALLHLTLLDHPRFDETLDLEVFRLTETGDWPEGPVADSLLETSGIVWSRGELSPGDASVAVSITNMIQTWSDDIYDDLGLLIRAASEDRGLTTVAFASPSDSVASRRPWVEVIYTTSYGGRP